MAWGSTSAINLIYVGGEECPNGECRGKLCRHGLMGTMGHFVAQCSSCQTVFCARCGQVAQPDGDGKYRCPVKPQNH